MTFLCLALLAAAGPEVQVRQVRFARVVDVGTRIPGQEGYFAGFSAPVIDGERVAFYAHGLSLQQGIYLYERGRLEKLVDQNEEIPGERAHFTVFGDPELHGESIVFFAHAASTRLGIYAATAGRIRALVLSEVPVRGVYGSFLKLDEPALHADGVAFLGFDGNLRQGIYTLIDGTISCVASQDTPIPNGDGLFDSFDGPALHGRRVAFRASTGGDRQGIYADLGGELRAIADTATPIPAGRGLFVGFEHPPTIEGNAVAFVGQGPDQQRGIYLWREGALSVVANNDTSIPGGSGQFSSFSAATMDGGAIAFQGLGLSGQSGIYLWHAGTVSKVVDLTDRLDEKTLLTLELRPGGLSDRHLAFAAAFSDGSEGIYMARLP